MMAGFVRSSVLVLVGMLLLLAAAIPRGASLSSRKSSGTARFRVRRTALVAESRSGQHANGQCPQTRRHPELLAKVQPLTNSVLPKPNSSSLAVQQQQTSDLVGLVTHGTADRLESLEKTLEAWPGPVAVAFYARDRSEVQALRDFAHKHQGRSNLRAVYVEANSSAEFVPEGDDEAPPPQAYYPTNLMRNLAMETANTELVLPVDMDFVPSTDAYTRILNEVGRDNSAASDSTSSGLGKNVALVVPAFEPETEPWRAPAGDEVESGAREPPLPLEREALRDRCASSRGFPPQGRLRAVQKSTPEGCEFHAWARSEPHLATDYRRWWAENGQGSYSIDVNRTVSEGYEPYFVVRREGLPRYDERFEGYGKNKISWVVCLRCIGYRFRVLQGAFLVHNSHTTQKAIANHSNHTAADFKRSVQSSKENFQAFMHELQCPKERRPLYHGDTAKQQQQHTADSAAEPSVKQGKKPQAKIARPKPVLPAPASGGNAGARTPPPPPEVQAFVCGAEGQVCEHCNGTVYYGVSLDGAKISVSDQLASLKALAHEAKPSNGSAVLCSNKVFGDPLESTAKYCICAPGAAAPRPS